MEEDDDKKKAKGGGVVGGDRAQRRNEREKRQKDRVKSPVPVDAVIDSADDGEERWRRRPKKHGRVALLTQRKEHAQIEPPVTVRSLSEAIGVKANEILTFLFRQGKAVRINDALSESQAVELAIEFGVDLKIVHQRTAEDDLLDAFIDETIEGDKTLRAPIITILGHVDHGKTSLLDKIRKSDVAGSESGGITQHIGAYQVIHNGHPITFLDTPGHEAFTSMRARGANVTDIVVLVVAADDGVMPQTEEAISHAKAADVPIVVALNKVDLPNVNFNRIYGELSQHGLVPEEYGGDTLVVKTSAHTGQGIPDLLENLLLIAELREFKGNSDRPAVGTCLEAQISEGRGVVATMLVQDGTMRIGDVVVCGDGYGRVRSMFNHRGEPVESAGPSMPVEVSGLDSVPEAGEKFAVLSDLSRAREISEARKMRSREQDRSERSAVTLENLFDRMNEQRVRSLNIILKADVQGSLEALTKELDKLENTEIPIRILHRAVGGISESDVQLADASQAIIIGFRVAPEDRAISLADEKKIDIRRYDIIYQVTDEVKKAIEGMLVPEIKETHLGRASVRQVFKISKVGTVAGCFVTQGTIERSAKVRLIRDGREIYKGSLEALKRFKDDVKEVREGFECGMRISNYDDLKTDDIIEAYKIEEIRRTL
jgi:translation initiation factor IF-2